MSNYPQNFGYMPDEKDERDYGFLGGKLSAEVLVPDGNWEQYLSPFEAQFKNFETSGCTVFAFLNCIEALARRKGYDLEDFSERFLCIMADIDPKAGGSPRKVADTARKIGLVSESLLPFDKFITTVEQFFSPKPMTDSLLKIANSFQKKWAIGYEEVPSDPQSIKQALTMSPLTCACKSWYQDKDGLYWFPPTANYNHDCCMFAAPKNYRFFDSYEQDKKEVRADATFQQIYRYTLEPKPQVSELTLIQRILNLIQQVIWKQKVLVERKVAEPPKNLPIIKENLPTAPEEVVSHVSLIEPWAKLIEKQEGGKPVDINMRLNNPGNLKFTELTKSLGAEQGWQAQDGGFFCKFKTYDAGFKALRSFLELACKNELKAYKDCTLDQFTEIYARPPNKNYVNAVAKGLKVAVTIPIKELL